MSTPETLATVVPTAWRAACGGGLYGAAADVQAEIDASFPYAANRLIGVTWSAAAATGA